MPIQTAHPGVYVQEIPSGVRTITGVSTSVAAFIDYFQYGLLNTPIQLLSEADIDRELGGIHINSEASFGLSQFFQNGGTEAWAVRVVRLGNNNVVPGVATIDLEDGVGVLSFTLQAGRFEPGLNPNALNPGAWANDLRIAVDYPEPDLNLPNPRFNLRIFRTRMLNGIETIIDSEVFLNLSMTPGDVEFVEDVINDRFRGSKWLRISAAIVANAPLPMETGTVTAQFNAPPAIAAGVHQVNVIVTFVGPNPPIPGAQNFNVNVDGVINTLERARDLLTEAIRSIPLMQANVSLEVNRIVSQAVVSVVDNRIKVSGGPAGRWDAVISFADTGDGTAVALQLPAAAANIQRYNLGNNGAIAGTGQGATVPGADPAANNLPGQLELVGSLAQKTGLYALEDVELFNILCIPRIAYLNQINNIVARANDYCERRRAFFILDIPEAVNTMQEMRAWIDGNGAFRHTHNAIYFPRIEVTDPTGDRRQPRPRAIATSGTMAGIYARTDAQRGVWKAPAGIEATLNGVIRLGRTLTNSENGVLNQTGINCLRMFGLEGLVSWGSRTSRGADALTSEWKYVPVRRTALYIEESLFRGLKWVVFEPNDEPLWAQIRLNVGAFMFNMYRQGAFQGPKRDAYFVKCDGETTTANDRALGVVNIIVGFAPLRPAEFVILSLQQMAGQIQV